MGNEKKKKKNKLLSHGPWHLCEARERQRQQEKCPEYSTHIARYRAMSSWAPVPVFGKCEKSQVARRRFPRLLPMMMRRRPGWVSCFFNLLTCNIQHIAGGIGGCRLTLIMSLIGLREWENNVENLQLSGNKTERKRGEEREGNRQEWGMGAVKNTVSFVYSSSAY